jgi:hypothetical protein
LDEVKSLPGRILSSLTILVFALFAGVGLAVADDYRPAPGIPDRYGILYDTPIYDPVSKSYFALAWAHKTVYRGTDWLTANAEARSREYKGIHGRLAVVDSLEIHEFLERTFHPNVDVWIGLRYWCQKKTLEWSNGRTAKRSFQAWDVNWQQDIYACKSGDKNTDFMPVAYTPTDKGFRWIGKGRHKEYFAYFVEFPTAHP